ncbi:MAG TPA: HD domain-containing phosphohydrolase [Solirubrobacterales bacterium]|nr:HD domain-containing phosphohydrolase [Solirubrobacterales bacterium]
MTGNRRGSTMPENREHVVSTNEYLTRRIEPGDARSVIGPTSFFALAIGLLTYDHIRGVISELVFWVGMGVIVVVFAWMLVRVGRAAERADAERERAHRDRLTGLRNGEALLEALEERCGERSAATLVLFEVEEHNPDAPADDRDAAAMRLADDLGSIAAGAGGDAYRLGGLRFAVLVPRDGLIVDDLVTRVRATLTRHERGATLTAHHGECEIPEDAEHAGAALDLAARRMTARERRGRRSPRRQAHAALVAALGTRRPQLREHLRTVVPLALTVGRKLDLDSDQLDDVVLAAGLQDVGMLSIPEAVLEKPAPLSDSERALVREQTVAGERIVASAASLEPVARLVRSAYEHFDGTGYPDGLAGEEIPLGARIINACVACAAMMAPRPHREALRTDQVIAELEACAGRQFDPRVVEVLVDDLNTRPAEPTRPPESHGAQSPAAG